MTEELEIAFVRYVELALIRLRPQPPESTSASLRVFRKPFVELNEIVESLEESELFQRLMDETQRAFPVKGLWIMNLWESDISNFFSSARMG